jgi:hypothetical protein
MSVVELHACLSVAGWDASAEAPAAASGRPAIASDGSAGTVASANLSPESQGLPHTLGLVGAEAQLDAPVNGSARGDRRSLPHDDKARHMKGRHTSARRKRTRDKRARDRRARDRRARDRRARSGTATTASGDQLRATQLRATQLRATQLRATQLRATQLRATQLRATQPRAAPSQMSARRWPVLTLPRKRRTSPALGPRARTPWCISAHRRPALAFMLVSTFQATPDRHHGRARARARPDRWAANARRPHARSTPDDTPGPRTVAPRYASRVRSRIASHTAERLARCSRTRRRAAELAQSRPATR